MSHPRRMNVLQITCFSTFTYKLLSDFGAHPALLSLAKSDASNFAERAKVVKQGLTTFCYLRQYSCASVAVLTSQRGSTRREERYI